MPWAPLSGIRSDLRARLNFHGWKEDWSEARHGKLRVLAAATYIFCASAIPALAFGEQLYADTGGILSAVHVLSATALTGLVQAVVGGQPLMIVGVAEPIVLIYKFLYEFAKDRQGLGPQLFLAWCAWVCVWAAAMILALAAANACSYINRFTRFAGELFGALIALLFMQQAIKGSVEEFRSAHQGVSEAEGSFATLANGLWSLVLAWGVLLCSLLCRQARSWRFLRAPLRGFLADYGAALMLVAFSGLGCAVRGVPGVPRRVNSPNTWEVTATWTVVRDMGSVEGRWIAAAIIPAILITILFFFDHNVSAQLAQQPEFNLRKGPSYHYDFLLLGFMTLACGLLGLPPVNGVLPQSPLHTKALAAARGRKRGAKPAAGEPQAEKEAAPLPGKAAGVVPADAAAGEIGGGSTAAVHGGSKRAGSEAAVLGGSPRAGSEACSTPRTVSDGVASFSQVHPSPSRQALLPASSRGGDAAEPAAVAGSGRSRLAPRHAGGAHGTHKAAKRQDEEGEDTVVQVRVLEQRVSGLLQSLGVGVCLAAMPAIRQIPTAVLWGYFAFMAVESLPGSQLWDRTLLLLTDPRCRPQLLERGHAPYLETVPFRVIVWFTAFQLAYLLGVYGLTWAGVAGILFPLPIMLLVPLRHHAMPRFFAHRQHLQELDAAEEEEAAALSRAQAMQEAAAQGMTALPGPHRGGPGAGEGGPGATAGAAGAAVGGAGEEQGADSGVDVNLDSELHRFRVVHRLSRASLLQRRLNGLEPGPGEADGITDGITDGPRQAQEQQGLHRDRGGRPPLPGTAPGSPTVRMRRQSHDLHV